MMRTAILMTVLFLGISGGALYMQWRDYEQARNGHDVPLVHFINVTQDGKTLKVQQTVTGLTTPIYNIQVPMGVKQLMYTIDNKQKTLTYDRSGKASVKTESDQIMFHYVLPLPATKPIWLDRWMITFFSTQPKQLYVQLTDYTKSGTWVAGAPLDATLKKEEAVFYSWSQKGVSSFPLYFYPMELQRSVYGTVEVYGINKMEKAEKWTDVPSFTLVWIKRGSPHLSPTLVVVPENVSLSSLQEMYMRTYYAAYFLPSGEINAAVADLLTAFTLQKQPVTPKGKVIWQQLTKNLTKDEQKAFFTAVLNERGKALTPAALDEILSASHPGQTTYFTDLFVSGRPQSLVFTNEGKVYVNNVPVKQAKAVLQNEKVLLPFVDVMTSLGYHVRRTGNAVFIEKGDNRWRFFVNSSIYMKGNDRFGAPAIIIYDINGELYMTPDMMQYWFPVQIWRTERDVYISAL